METKKRINFLAHIQAEIGKYNILCQNLSNNDDSEAEIEVADLS